jgi:carbonic anhydrase
MWRGIGHVAQTTVAPTPTDGRGSLPDSPFHPNADELIGHNARYAEQFADRGLSLRPRRQLAIVACMDSRMDIFQMLGLAHGEAHIIRNAGGVVTDDVIRSLVLSQRFLGTREIILVHHTDCGLQSVREDDFKAEIEAETGIRPWWALESFTDPYANVGQSIKRLQLSPFIRHKDHISGFVYDMATGMLRPVG